MLDEAFMDFMDVDESMVRFIKEYDKINTLGRYTLR
jgi:histidinol-phosphate/aromatic aminotransferase/cobyric acid decarboxylase-like protein